MPWKILRWIETSLDNDELKSTLPGGAALGRDDQDRRVMLFVSEWSLKYFSERNPSMVFLDSPRAEHKGPIYDRD